MYRCRARTVSAHYARCGLQHWIVTFSRVPGARLWPAEGTDACHNEFGIVTCSSSVVSRSFAQAVSEKLCRTMSARLSIRSSTARPAGTQGQE